MKRPASPAPKPPAVYGRAEKNPRLHTEKADILKKLDFRRDSVMRQRGFGIALAALGRISDALSVLDYAHTNVEYRGSAEVWYAAGTACAVAGYLRRKERDEARAVEDLKRFIDQPCAAIIFQSNIWTADFIGKHLTQERARFAPGYDSPKPQAALESRTWWIATLVFFHEMALAGYPRTGGVDIGQLDRWIDDAFAELAAWLGEPARVPRAESVP